MRRHQVRRSPGRTGAYLATTGMLLLVLAGCYPPTDLDPDDFDVAITIYDDGLNFGAFQTYVMPDSVVHIETDNTIDISRQYDDLILQEVEDQMADLGYVRSFAPQADGVDLALLVSVAGTETNFYYEYYPWCDYWGWYGWYYPCYDWYYPPSYIGQVTIEQGTILLTMIENPDLGGPDEIPLVWAAGIRGVLSGGAAADRITRGIDQAFVQSPYLGTN